MALSHDVRHKEELLDAIHLYYSTNCVLRAHIRYFLCMFSVISWCQCSVISPPSSIHLHSLLLFGFVPYWFCTINVRDAGYSSCQHEHMGEEALLHSNAWKKNNWGPKIYIEEICRSKNKSENISDYKSKSLKAIKKNKK